MYSSKRCSKNVLFSLKHNESAKIGYQWSMEFVTLCIQELGKPEHFLSQ